MNKTRDGFLNRLVPVVAFLLIPFGLRGQALISTIAGVEVVIPAGGLPSLLFSRIKNFRVGRAVVLDCIAVLAKTAELAVALQRFNGTGASRLATFQKPSAKALKEFLDN